MRDVQGNSAGSASSILAAAVCQGQCSVLTVWCCTVFTVVTLWAWNQVFQQLQWAKVSAQYSLCDVVVFTVVTVGVESSVSAAAVCHYELSLLLCGC